MRILMSLKKLIMLPFTVSHLNGFYTAMAAPHSDTFVPSPLIAYD